MTESCQLSDIDSQCEIMLAQTHGHNFWGTLLTSNYRSTESPRLGGFMLILLWTFHTHPSLSRTEVVGSCII